MKISASFSKNLRPKLFIFCSLFVALFAITGCQNKQKADEVNDQAGDEDKYTMEITSDNLKDGVWDDIITNTEYGENISPRLKWDKVDGAACYAVIMIDPDGNNWLHWLETDIREIGIDAGYTADKNKYIGPYPPGGTHRYQIYVLALKESKEPASARFNSGGNDIDRIISELSENDNCLGSGYIEGTYTAKYFTVFLPK